MTKSDLDLFASPDFSAFKTVPRTPSRAYLATQGKMLPTTKEISTGEENKSEKSTVSAINLPNKESEKSIEPINLKVHTSTKSSQSIDSNNSSRKQTPVSATHKATALDPKDQIVTEIVSSVVNPQPVETLEERERRLKQEYVDMKIKDIQLEAQLELQRLKEKADEAKAKWDRIGGGNPLMTPEGLNTINTKVLFHFVF